MTDSSGDLDVLRQCVAVEHALHELGHTTQRVDCGLDLESVRANLLAARCDVVFNLVESLGGTDRLMPVAAILLESLGLPFTGASSRAMLLTTEKTAAKQIFLDQELPTPAWIRVGHVGDPEWLGLQPRDRVPEQAIIKAVWEHASLGLEDQSVVTCEPSSVSLLAQEIRRREIVFRTPHFAEQYIDGREFNLSILAGAAGPEVLPPAEIEFVDFPDDKPRIVGHKAKWDEATSEYHNTPRRFQFPHQDLALLDELCALARRCWTAFGLRGYARVDFRVDADGQPWILEINANPCLSADAGFAAAVQQAGLTFRDVVARILNDSMIGN